MSSPKQLGTVGNNAIIFSNLRLFKLNPQTYAYFQFPEKIQNQHISIISKLQKSQNIIQVAFVEVAVPIIQQEPVKASAKDEISKVLPVLRCFFRCPFLHQRTSIMYEKNPRAWSRNLQTHPSLLLSRPGPFVLDEKKSYVHLKGFVRV